MAKMWASNEDLEFETARDHASKLVLLGSAQKAGIFEALREEKDIATLKHRLDVDERALFIFLEALRARLCEEPKLSKFGALFSNLKAL